MEVWKQSVGQYMISNLGRIKSPKRTDASGHERAEKIIKSYVTCFGYERVNLYVDGKRKNYYVHRLVAEAFIENDNSLLQINHIDGNKLNNKVNNLEWVTGSYNQKHAYKNGLKFPKYNDPSVSKKVKQYSLSGEFIRDYLSSKEVERETGFYRSNICACCRGTQKTAYGFIWSYE